MVDLKAKPFYLTDEDIAWVEETIAGMSLEEKIGQMFINLGSSFDEEYLEQVVTKYHVGGVRYNPGTARQVYEQNAYMQKKAKIPLLIAANMESGGNGACIDGTLVGNPVQIGATKDSRFAFEMGRISGMEGAAVGCNWSFAPVVDINYNWRNPVAATRCFGDDPDTVLSMSLEYFRGIRESGIACAMKHFPGDGVDERDQHLLTTVNSFDCGKWDETYGKVYRGMIDAGIQSIMAGHIMLPAYSKRLNPRLEDGDILPASLSHELLEGLLRRELGFNGLILTDASGMAGLTTAMRREDLVPGAIAAGCDMFLFFNDPEEDIEFMKQGILRGIISQERLDDVLHRILGLKASLGLHRKKRQGTLMPPVGQLSVVGCESSERIARETADRSITLVKNKGGLIPLSPSKYRKVLLVMLGGESIFFGLALKSCKDIVRGELELAGFEVEEYESPVERSQKNQEEVPTFLQLLSSKNSIRSFRERYDAVFLFANVQGFGQQNPLRIKWGSPLGKDIPWYVTEVPVVFVSLNVPFHLVDVPMVKAYVNAYAPTRTCIHEAIRKITGDSEFHGVSPVDAFCGLWDTKR